MKAYWNSDLWFVRHMGVDPYGIPLFQSLRCWYWAWQIERKRRG